jgi:hypothetical protein
MPFLFSALDLFIAPISILPLLAIKQGSPIIKLEFLDFDPEPLDSVFDAFRIVHTPD